MKPNHVEIWVPDGHVRIPYETVLDRMKEGQKQSDKKEEASLKKKAKVVQDTIKRQNRLQKLMHDNSQYTKSSYNDITEAYETKKNWEMYLNRHTHEEP